MNVLKQKIVLEEIEISEKEAFSKFITSIAGEELTNDLKQLNIDAWELTISDFWDKYEEGLKGLWHFGKTVTI